MDLYGVYNKVFNYLWIFAFLADLGLYTIAVREISLWNEKKDKIIWNVLTLRTLLWVVIWIGAFLLALVLPWYGDSLTLWAIFIIGAFTLVSLMNSTFLALMQSQMKMEFSLVSLVSGKVINLLLVWFFLIYLFQWGGSISFAFISVFIAAFIWVAVTTFCNYKYAQNICSITFLYDLEYIKHIFKISLPYGIALFLSVVYFKIDIIILSLLESPESANISIALYGLPMKIIEVLMVVGAFYMNAVLPSMTQSFWSNWYTGLQKYIPLSLKVLGSFWILVLISWSLFAEEIIRIIANNEYITPINSIYSSLDAFFIVLWVLVFHFLSLVFIYLFIASKRQGILLYINGWITLFNIIWNIILIPYFSFIWAAIVTLISQILLMWVSYYVIKKDVHISVSAFMPLIISIIIWFFTFAWTYYLKVNYSFSDIWNIIVYWFLVCLIYGGCEYIFSKKLLKSLR